MPATTRDPGRSIGRFAASHRGPPLAPLPLMRLRCLTLVACITVVRPALSAAQDTREATIAVEQADKANRVAPYVPHPIEKYLERARRTLIDQPSGVYPFFGSVYSGGGFTLGAGYREYVADRTHLDVVGLYSLKNYKFLEVSATSPGHVAGRLDFRVAGSWRDATQVAYYGLGIDSTKDLDTAFRMKQGIVGGSATFRPVRHLLLTGVLGLEDYEITDPAGSHTPVEEAFTPDTAPGVGTDPMFVHSAGIATFDWTPSPGYARTGGRYSIGHHRYTDADDAYSFERLDVDLVQHVPILRETWVLSFHGRLQTTLDASDQVPFFMLPSLGSGSTLRGYTSWRFRDRHAALASGEFRWIPNRMVLDMAFFYDTGMVAPTLDAIEWDRFASNVGVGIRFHTPLSTPLRVEVARGSEGVNLVFSASAAF
jgi:hypothetical protein